MKARVWRESPGDWRCRIPGGEVSGPSWEMVMKVGEAIAAVPPLPDAPSYSDWPQVRRCPCMPPLGSGVCGCVLNGTQVYS